MTEGKVQPLGRTLAVLVVGITIGTCASWPLLYGLDSIAPTVDDVMRLLLPTLGLALLFFAIVGFIGWRYLRSRLSSAQATLSDTVSNIRLSLEANANGDLARASHHAEQAVLSVASWLGDLMARRFMVNSALAALVGFGGMIGTALLFRQIALLGIQNQKIDEQVQLLRIQNFKLELQNVTAEAQRRSALSAELFSIMQQVAGDLGKEADTIGKELSPGLVARIVTFSGTATPYWIAEMPENADGSLSNALRLADRPRSPERGELLKGLVSMRANIKQLTEAGADFRGADLRRAKLLDAKLSGVVLSSADLTEANLAGAEIDGAHLYSATLKDAFLYDVDLTAAKLIGANLEGAYVDELAKAPPGWTVLPMEQHWRLGRSPK